MATKLRISDISDDYCDLRDVIGILGVSQRMIYWLIEGDEEFPETYKLGQRSIWRRSDIETYRDLRWRRKNIALTLWERWLASDTAGNAQ